MNISDIIDLVKVLCNGIKSNGMIDPVAHANLFEQKIWEDLDGDYTHQDGIGYVCLDGEDIVLVHWLDDGVTFQDHTFHDEMMKVVRAALYTMNELEEQNETEDEPSEDWEWI
eukprot:GHVU01000078.1.p1 GENE.GHVU01000078.1~~GHVU01000078.1.p1  ORF type:complete len:113 (-),score=20.95 GHVU01000078.1:238-576(-)